MSLTKEILRITARYHPIGYSQLFEYLYNETVYGKKLNENSVRAIVKRMEKNGLIKKNGKKWLLTVNGGNNLEKRHLVIKKFLNPKDVMINRQKEKKLIIIFDIPEKKKKYREWLRTELIGYGFSLVQKSVWFGPPLPKEFVEYLGEAGLLKYVKFFKASERDLI
ncbi:MAG: hypothetical protein NUV78_01985 [Candidatus Zambryskibacteria bacterium]|nr:hypothetical protein [Candidatus Zambryskibacteria bacterium]